jgi:hypothetical protein
MPLQSKCRNNSAEPPAHKSQTNGCLSGFLIITSLIPAVMGIGMIKDSWNAWGVAFGILLVVLSFGMDTRAFLRLRLRQRGGDARKLQ